MSRKILVGIVTSPSQGAYFSNGLHQNAYYLYKLLQKVPQVQPLLVFPPGQLKIPVDSIEIFGETAHSMNLFIDKYHLDALLFVSAAVDSTYLDKFRKNGVKMAAVIYGNRYVMDQETFVFGHLEHPEEGEVNVAARELLREDADVDAVWLSPHFAWQKDYIKHRYSAKRAYICPYVWDPELLDLKYSENPHFKENSPLFQIGSPNNKDIFCTEPNINVLKTSLFPYLAVNTVYEKGNKDLGHFYLFNSIQVNKLNKEAAPYLRYFPLLKDKKVTFEGRYGLPTMTKHAQIMFHHHFENGLNYTLLEAARLKLPIVHNSEFMPELGYYYKRANLTDAAKQIEAALLHEERDDLAEYNKTCEEVIERFGIDNEENIRGYQTLLANLIDPKIEPELPQYIINLEDKLDHEDGYVSPIS